MKTLTATAFKRVSEAIRGRMLSRGSRSCVLVVLHYYVDILYHPHRFRFKHKNPEDTAVVPDGFLSDINEVSYFFVLLLLETICGTEKIGLF